MAEKLEDLIPKVETLANDLGLEYYPVEFELVPPSFMMEVAVYGLPVRMPHWSFGVRWIYQMVQHRMGHSRIFEVVFPGNPNRAYLVNTNSLEENILVVAHVLGHADFSHNNLTFVRSQEQVGYRIVEQAAAHARRIAEVIEEIGEQRVEQVLDVALALEPHIDTNLPLNRSKYRPLDKRTEPEPEGFRGRYQQLPGEAQPERKTRGAPEPLHIPPHPERDLLWFIATHAPEMEDWERDIFLAVRKEAYYFQPVFNCQIMNEGWASYWHSRLLREADFLSGQIYVDSMKTHSDVVRPYAGEHQVALQVNPYHLGYSLWEHLLENGGLEAAREIRREEDDFGFIRNYFTAELADEMGLFVYSAKKNGEIRVTSSNIHELHEAILQPKFNFGAPRVVVDELKSDGTLILRHEHENDGRGLDLERARHVLEYIDRIWRRPVKLYTIDERGRQINIKPSWEID
ncbi:SpoVR family protein [Nitrococcus mobilis]|uniref:Stage V sporulation protein R n=1 Tax=Nitrococcus mobilis Nb-231 TaxID=314278 RepID=A4BNQ8_9GAMM|nr:SpoVR family protein [Nitrococcus mobilis]EAR22857.1 stage V sporulation protein R [Nitrococcus mobilis Nb-231]